MIYIIQRYLNNLLTKKLEASQNNRSNHTFKLERRATCRRGFLSWLFDLIILGEQLIRFILLYPSGRLHLPLALRFSDSVLQLKQIGFPSLARFVAIDLLMMKPKTIRGLFQSPDTEHGQIFDLL